MSYRENNAQTHSLVLLGIGCGDVKQLVWFGHRWEHTRLGSNVGEHPAICRGEAHLLQSDGPDSATYDNILYSRDIQTRCPSACMLRM